MTPVAGTLDPPPNARAASAIARELFAHDSVPMLSLAVANGPGVIWAEALGKANLEFGVPAAVEHLMRLGSVSKPITATAAARLVTRGLLDLDVPIAYWLPDLPAHHRETTMRQLL